MSSIFRSRIAAAAFVAVLAACGRSAPSSTAATSANPGTPGSTFLITVQRPTHGNVSSGADGRINCGSGAAATLCGPVAYGWSEQAILVATADAGYMVGTWVGDCSGRPTDAQGRYICVLDTSKYGADKYVGVTFGLQGQVLHSNFSLPTVHGPAFWNFIEKIGDYYNCWSCHGADYNGRGIAPSCNQCHANAGFPNWLTTCNFCHGQPPVNGKHPAVSSDITRCWTCHQTTVDRTGTIIPAGAPTNGTHMDGHIQAIMHDPGYDDPKVHARDFFQSISGNGGLVCSDCHGTNYDVAITNDATPLSCLTCHQTRAGWVGDWRTNCTFCHGTRTLTYGFATPPPAAAPPQAISVRLGETTSAPDRVGAHQLHLSGSAFAGPFQCGVCHQSATTLGHIRGRDARAVVTLFPPGAAAPDPDGYNTTTQTCATKCHGTGGSPAWTSTGIQCGDCHGIPPTLADDPQLDTTAHQGLVQGDSTQCNGCHPDTVKPDGTIDVAGGKHLNGTVDHVAGHASGFALPTNHGPQFLNYAGRVQGALDCTTCHGSSLTLCNWCHSQQTTPWQAWETNCTFCHGARLPVYTAADLMTSSPPDDVSQRLGATLNPFRVGKHAVHLADGTGLYAKLPCTSCHAVPATVFDPGHITTDRRATVTMTALGAFPGLTPLQQGRLPSTFGTYDPSTGRCSVYCHGSAAWGGATSGGIGLTPRWTTGGTANCNTCHGQPPLTGKTMPEDDLYCFDVGGCSLHDWHLSLQSTNFMDTCAACHNNNVHINGVVDIAFLSPNGRAGTVTGSWDVVNGSCTVSCHTRPTTPYTWRQWVTGSP